MDKDSFTPACRLEKDSFYPACRWHGGFRPGRLAIRRDAVVFEFHGFFGTGKRGEALIPFSRLERIDWKKGLFFRKIVLVSTDGAKDSFFSLSGQRFAQDLQAELKKSVRVRARQKRAAMSADQRALASRRIARRLFAQAAYEQASSVLFYVSFGDEVDTFPMIARALLDGKAVFCPRVQGKRMDFYRIQDLSELRSGFRRIMEPVGGARFVPGADTLPALMVAPGIAFDRKGGRVGYGGGYYDRYLSSFPRGRRPVCAGLGFGCQLFPNVWADGKDQAMDLVITPEGVWRRETFRG